MNSYSSHGPTQYNSFGVSRPLVEVVVETSTASPIRKEDLLGQNEPENGRYRNKPTGELGVGEHRVLGYDGVPNFDKEHHWAYEDRRRAEKDHEMKREAAKNARKIVEDDLEADQVKGSTTKLDRNKAANPTKSQKQVDIKQDNQQDDVVKNVSSSAAGEDGRLSTTKRTAEQNESTPSVKRSRSATSHGPIKNKTAQGVLTDPPATPTQLENERPKTATAQQSSPRSESKAPPRKKKRCIIHRMNHKARKLDNVLEHSLR